MESLLDMKYIIKLVLISIVLFGCTKKNCVKSSDLSFYELNETDRSFYIFTGDSFTVSVPKYVTPNNDSINDFFEMQTNVDSDDYITSKFTVINECEDVVHVETNSFPFTFPGIENLEDGQYDFTLAVVLDKNKDVIAGSGQIRILRK